MNLDFYRDAIENYFKDIEVPEGTFLAGGSILSLLTGNKINDLDLYLNSKESVAQFLSDNDNVYLHSVTEKSISLSIQHVKQGTKEFQLIYFNSYNSAEEIFADFDFSVCCCAYSFDTKEFYFHDDFWKDIASKKLKFNNGTKFPVISLLHVAKYKDKGYSVSNAELRKIALAISKLNLEDKKSFMSAYGSMYGSESLVDLILEDDSLFNCDTALERFSSDYQEPTLIFNDKNVFPNRIEKPTPYPKDWMVDYLLQQDSYHKFKQQPFYVEVEGTGKNKKYNLFGVENSRIKGEERPYSETVTESYAQAHILLYKDCYDPLIKSLNSMVEKGKGFSNSKPEYDDSWQAMF